MRCNVAKSMYRALTSDKSQLIARCMYVFVSDSVCFEMSSVPAEAISSSGGLDIRRTSDIEQSETAEARRHAIM